MKLSMFCPQKVFLTLLQDSGKQADAAGGVESESQSSGPAERGPGCHGESRAEAAFLWGGMHHQPAEQLRDPEFSVTLPGTG